MKSVKKRIYPSASEANGNGNSNDHPGTNSMPMVPNESTPLHTASKSTQVILEPPKILSNHTGTQTLSHEDSVDADNGKIEANNGHVMGAADIPEDEDDPPGYPWQPPTGCLAKIWWLCFFPVNLLLFLTIPDVRRPKFVNWFPFSFAMCMAWIGAISYEVTWLITIIGYTINVPDSVMGLSFLAVGTSMPEVFSSLIVSRQVNISVSSVKTFSWAFLTASNVV